MDLHVYYETGLYIVWYGMVIYIKASFRQTKLSKYNILMCYVAQIL